MSSATITGRNSGHRGLALKCPGCATALTAVELPEAEAEVDVLALRPNHPAWMSSTQVDVCDACGGLWVDWFDGEVRKVATETLRVSEPSLKAAVPVGEEVSAIGACPRCSQHLVAERYIMTSPISHDGGRTSLVGQETGAELLRCEACMGAFVPRVSAEVLAFLDAGDDAPESRGPTSLAQPLPWERFVKVLKSLIGLR